MTPERLSLLVEDKLRDQIARLEQENKALRDMIQYALVPLVWKVRAEAAEERLAQVTEALRHLQEQSGTIGGCAECETGLALASASLPGAGNRIAAINATLEACRRRGEPLTDDQIRELLAATPPVEPPMYVCNKCGYVGETPLHNGCNYYAAWAEACGEKPKEPTDVR